MMTGVDATGKLTYSEAAMRYYRLSAVERLGTGTFWVQASSNAVTRGALASAQGGKFATGMVGGFTGTMLSSTAQIIGDVTREGFSLENVLLHTGLGCVGALAAGDKCAAGAIGGGVSAAVSPWVGKAFSESGPRTPVEKTITAVASVTAGMGVAAALGYDHLPAGQAAQNEVMNNFLDHIEAEERAAAQRRLNACGEDAVCKAQASAEIARLNELDEQRDRDMEHACRLPTSAACQAWRAQLLDAQNSYKEMSNQADLSVLKEKSEIEQLVGTFDARVKHSTTFNAFTGATQSIGEGITGTAQLLELSRRALAGDAQAQAQLRQIGATLRKALANPVDTVSRSIKDELALADRLDILGRHDEATQVRSKLVTSGVLSVTGAGAVAVKGGQTIGRWTGRAGAHVDELAGEAARGSWKQFDKSIAYIDEPIFNPKGSIGAAQQWSIKARIKHVELPTEGNIRYIPPEGYSPNMPLPRGPNNGYIDKFGNEWTKGPSRTLDQSFEWDVQLSKTGKSQLGWASRDGTHLNISLDGKITHK